MGSYVISGRGDGGPATGTNSCMGQLWNPSSTVPLFVSRILVATSGTGAADYAVFRSSTRGTAATTVTADIDNDLERALAPPSGALLDLPSFTTNNPTYSGSSISPQACRGLTGFGVFFIFNHEIKVKPGTGLCVLRVVSATGTPADLTFWWFE